MTAERGGGGGFRIAIAMVADSQRSEGGASTQPDWFTTTTRKILLSDFFLRRQTGHVCKIAIVSRCFPRHRDTYFLSHRPSQTLDPWISPTWGIYHFCVFCRRGLENARATVFAGHTSRRFARRYVRSRVQANRSYRVREAGTSIAMLHSLPDIRRCDEYADIDFKNEDEVKRFVRPSRWLSIDFGEGKRLLRVNVRLPRSRSNPFATGRPRSVSIDEGRRAIALASPPRVGSAAGSRKIRRSRESDEAA